MRAALGVLLAAWIGLDVAGVHLVGPYGWDDGAVTLAYARTLAEHGAFALTAASEVVEGTSSLLLTFLLAGLHRLLGFTFTGFILASQLLALGAAAALMLLLHRSLQSAVPDAATRAVVVLLLGALPAFTAEIYNGMEMTLFALLLTALAVAYERQPRWLALLVPLTLLARFEAVFYLGFALGLLLLWNRAERRKAAGWAAYVAVTFALIEGARWAYFGDILPNTIWAKMNPPYSSTAFTLLNVISKLAGLREFATASGLLLVLAAVSLLLRRSWLERFDFKVLLAASFGAFALVTGRNTGYEGRMVLACLPLLVLVAADSFRNAVPGGGTLRLGYGPLQVRQRGADSLAALLVAALLGCHWSGLDLLAENLRSAALGGYYQQRLPGPLNRALAARVAGMSQEFHDWYGVTPANYRITGTAVDRIRGLAGLEVIRFLTPDVGGVGLCCKQIAVLDSGLLTNRFLARHGYRRFGEYLRRTRPQVIETHWFWSELSGIYALDFFQQGYQPIVFDNNLLWVDLETAAKLLGAPSLRVTPVGDVGVLDRVRYGGFEVDRDYLRQYGAKGRVWRIDTR